MPMTEVSVPIAHELLAQCIKQGQALVQRASLVGDFSDYESWKAARNQWVEPTVQALDHMYGGPSQRNEFMQSVTVTGAPQSWQQQYAADLDAVKAAIELLTVLQSDLAFVKDETHSPPDVAQLTDGQTAPAPARETGDDFEAPEEPLREQELPAQARDRQPAEPADEPEPEAPRSGGEPPQPSGGAEPPEPAHVRAVEPSYEPRLRDRDERPDDEPSVGAELAPAPTLAPELAGQANGSLSAERAASPGPAPTSTSTKQVLLAHGPNERWLQAVTNLLEHAGRHEVTILNDRSGERGALADQFGERTPGSRYAIVLLTADDIGAPRVDSEDEPYFSPRAHQAVVFEMGFLVAALTPGSVCVLYEEGVQLPCDLEDIAYVRLDMAGTWQPKLLLQLRKAGFDYDLNKLAAA
jgi:predicted nucleotide-binding protein